MRMPGGRHRHQQVADPRLRLVGAHEDDAAGEARRAGGVDLSARYPPVVAVAPGERAGQATAGGCAEIGLDPERIDEGALRHRVAPDRVRERPRPGRAGAVDQPVLEQRHRQHQGDRRIAGPERTDDLCRPRQPGPAAIEPFRHGEPDQTCFAQGCDRPVRKSAGAIALTGFRGKVLGQTPDGIERRGGHGHR
ncbi:hypothetical protein M2437_000487 [Methylorubrum pseudosasae]|nr:hypothetical protein [Methylorubrum pseudosasae]